MHHPPARRRSLARLGVIGALSVALVVPAQVAHATPLPDYLDTPTSSPGSYRAENIAADRTAANFFYRIPALAHLGDGVVLASWDGRPGSAADAPNPNSIVQRRSTDNGVTWGETTVIAAGRTSAPKFGYSDPSYVVDHERGRVFAFFVYSKDQGFHGSEYGDDDANRNVIGAAVMHSDDKGITWSEPRLITDVAKTSNGTTTAGVYAPVAGDVRSTFATSGEGIQLRYGSHKGRLIQQYAGKVRQADGSEPIQAYSVYSDDHGETWRRGEYVGTGMDENKTVELSDGRVMLNSRDSANGRMRKVAISEDGGNSYGPVIRDPELPDPTNNASITRLHPDAAQGSADAKKLIFTNANNGANGDRKNGAVRLSCDDGETWPGLRTIETGTFGYSTATPLDAGRIGVLWEGNYTNRMIFSSFDEAWINAVCAPVSVPNADLQPGVATRVPVTVTNQEAVALNGTVSFFTTGAWRATEVPVQNLAPGASTTVQVEVTAPADAGGVQQLQASFTTADGRVSQTSARLQLPAGSDLGATLSVTNTSAARNVVTNPYRVGETLSFSVRAVSTANEVTTVTPADATFTTGFAPTACRYRDLPAKGAYNCTTPRRTLTQEDIDRGWYAPEFAFSVAANASPDKPVVVRHTGAPVLLLDGVAAATITGERADGGRDLTARPYAVGDQVPYEFRVDSGAPVTMTVVPTAGAFSGFLPPQTPNCRFRDLAAGKGYDCTTAAHVVTQEDLGRGFFVADTAWRLEIAGQTPRELPAVGGEVDVIARAPKLDGATAGVWADVNGNGFADAGDTVTWTTTVRNVGNVTLDDVRVADQAHGSLAAGERVELEPVVQVLGTDVPAQLAAPELTVTAANGQRAVTATIAGDAVVLPGAPTPDEGGTDTPGAGETPGAGNTPGAGTAGPSNTASSRPAAAGLAVTGAESGLLAGVGATLLAAGAAVWMLRRRRRGMTVAR